MTVERTLLLAVWLICGTALLIWIPRDRVREAAIVFLFNQTITWSLSLLLAELHWIENPVREFPKATNTNFTNNYMLFPVLSVFFCIYYPAGKGIFLKIGYNAVYIAGVSLYTALLARYTELVKLTHFSLGMNAVIFFFGFNLTRLYSNWFFRKSQRKV